MSHFHLGRVLFLFVSTVVFGSAVFAGDDSDRNDPFCGKLLGGRAYVFQGAKSQVQYQVHSTLAVVRVIPGKEAEFAQKFAVHGVISGGPRATPFKKRGLTLVEWNRGTQGATLNALVYELQAQGVIDFYAPFLEMTGGTALSGTTGELIVSVADQKVPDVQKVLSEVPWTFLLKTTSSRSDAGMTEILLSSHQVFGTQAYDLRLMLEHALKAKLGTVPDVTLNFIQIIAKP